MHTPSLVRGLFLISFFVSAIGFSQDKPIGSETVIVVKPYTPSVNDAFKIRETPRPDDSVDLRKKPVKYSIFSVPVASTFSPSKGKATRVERAKREKLYDNYATLGFGTYSQAMAEFYSNMEVNRNDNFGIFLTHNSSQGGIEGVQLDDKYYDTSLELGYNSRNKKSAWNTSLGLQHQLFNWYGLPALDFSEEVVMGIDPQQNYFSASIGADVELYDSFFETAAAEYRYFGDPFSSAEHNAKAEANFEINIADELIDTKISTNLVSGSFARGYETPEGMDYSHMNVGITPSLLILRDELTLNLGVSVVYNHDGVNDANSLYLYPKVTASYRVAEDYFIAIAGVEGGLQQNTYYGFSRENPFVSPTLRIVPTDKPYDAYLGAKGKISNYFSYKFQGGYKSEFNKPLFLNNSFTAQNTEGYSFGNSFGVVYDDVTTLSFSGELNVDVRKDFRLGVSAGYYSYSTQFEEEAWNLPEYNAAIMADYQITQNWFAGAKLFFMGERKDRQEFLDLTGGRTERTVNVESFLDINAKVGYKFNEQLLIFARGANLLGNNYERWTDFPVQGLQILAGATYKFDF